MQQFVKDPQDVLDYQIDWSDWLDTDTISTSAWVVQTGLTKDSSSNTTTTATVWLSGGTNGNQYVLTNTITTANGRTVERSFIVKVSDSDL